MRPGNFTLDEINWEAVEKFFPKKHLTMYAGGGIWVRAKEAVTTPA